MSESENPTLDTTDLLNTAEIAKAFKVSRGAVQNWVNDGMPVAVRGQGRRPNLFNLEHVRAWRQKSHGKLDPQAERARKDKASADGIEIRNAVMLGQLVDADSVVDHWADMVGAARAKLLALPTKLATVAVACNTLEEIKHGADELVKEVLQELAGDPVPRQSGLDTAAELDGQPVGGSVQEAESGGERGAGPVED